MKETMVFTGGARLGWVKATWPFGRLTVSSGELTISLALAGRYVFTPAEVSGFERFGPGANGIRIVHTRTDYPKTIVFWYGNRQRVLDAAMRAGFDARVTSSSTPRRGMPFRWIAVAQLVVASTVLAVFDQALRTWSGSRQPGPMMMAALAMLLGAAFAIQISEAAQAWALKPGRTLSEVAPVLRLAQLIGGFLLARMALQILF